MKFLSSDVSVNQFADLKLPQQLLQTLSTMPFRKPTSIQGQALPVALEGHDLIAIAQTGSGKTLIYMLAILDQLYRNPDARALVLAPSREVATQVFNSFYKVSESQPVTSVLIISGTSEKEQVSKLKKNPRLIVATPGRLMDHLKNNKLLLQKLSILVLDEADRMLEVGFASQLKAIKATLRGEWQTLMLGASFNDKAEKFASSYLRPEAYVVRAAGAEKPVEELKQLVIYLDAGQKPDQLMNELKKTKGPVVVFVKDQIQTEAVHQHIESNGLGTDYIHGNLKNGHRERVVRDFRAGKFRVLVTTDLLARGLDVPGIELVVNYDLPNETEDFLHRIGRTARAGQKGKAVTFICKSEEKLVPQFKKYLEGAEEIHKGNFKK
jgi:superfamily II DNA/RNA helicase